MDRCGRDTNGGGTPRIACFTDCYDEVNGVGVTSREMARLARRFGRPFLLAHGGPASGVEMRGTLRTVRLRRGGLSVRLEPDFLYDPVFLRHARQAAKELGVFRPDIVHVNGPGDVGQLGVLLARRRRIPLVAVWHTNVPEFFESRLARRLTGLGLKGARHLPALGRRLAEAAVLGFYRLADLVLVRTPEDAERLGALTGRPTRVLRAGVDVGLFDPRRRWRGVAGPLRIGYAGRLSPEKNLRSLVDLERRLEGAGFDDFRIVLVGTGTERPWLSRHLAHAEFTGVLHGVRLAQTLADLDLFVFPSRTDTLGLAVLEAQACGVPAVVRAEGGPRHAIVPGETGVVASDEETFGRAVVELLRDGLRRRRMGNRARCWALSFGQTSAFEDLYEIYRACASRRLKHRRS